MFIYLDPTSATNGAGTQADPKNTAVGLTWSSGVLALKRGTTLRETITCAAGANDVLICAYGIGADPVIDCESTRAIGIDTSAKRGVTVRGVRIVNQIGAVNNAAIKVSGPNTTIRGCSLIGNQVAVATTSAASGLVVDECTIDCGHAAVPEGNGYGVRLLGPGSSALRSRYTSSVGSAVGGGTFFQAALQFYGGAAIGGLAYGNWISADACDAINTFADPSQITVAANVVDAVALKSGIACEDATYCTLSGNTVIQPNAPGETSQPGLKLGDNFGAGSPADYITVRGNLATALTGLPCTTNTMGGNCVFDGNYYRYGGAGAAPADTVIGWYVFGGSQTWYSLAALQSAQNQEAYGLSGNGQALDWLSAPSGVPVPITAALRGAGPQPRYSRDYHGRLRRYRPTYGAVEA